MPENDIFAGINNYKVDSHNDRMTIDFTVFSSDFSLEKYQAVYQIVRKALEEKGFYESQGSLPSSSTNASNFQTPVGQHLKAKIHFTNVEELQQLLARAATLTDQLRETLQQIGSFEPVIETSFQKATAATAAEETNKKIVETNLQSAFQYVEQNSDKPTQLQLESCLKSYVPYTEKRKSEQSRKRQQ
ncbi:hypothetical protein [Siminovitchia terrae]|uniref:hypothetical protein n=1 Tax=Siminovitchia terrae TaxID=1914933 RepID=UPI0028A878E4|nr:hypothetical protein [Siminovitchia terrae]